MIKRGDIVTVSLRGDYGKPRPAVVIQSDLFSEHPSITILPITSEIRETPLFRYTVKPSEINGLNRVSQVMIDKLHTVAREQIGIPFGALSRNNLLEIERLLSVFLGIA
ncbi:type II toxin-antitoxin system PemK/MazF family toxin [Caedibacter taeniospiralis]|jgi:mRNA interferase MazF|uniref:type II toxin-antitoxin system PemK/MazF family toxin n=1 Tax=Caedibacter taeniospiralis TaxID=28907 RepID=UPI000C273899|nr:type II toxin-antitoxin system PemK/MazF family toxin [Caedibacter taeniospiralis]